MNECIRIISDPEGFYESQQKLASSQNELERLKIQQQYFLDLIHGLPEQRNLIKQQHLEKIIDMPELKAKLIEMDNREKNLGEQLDMIQQKLSQKTISVGYAKALDQLATRYEKYGGL